MSQGYLDLKQIPPATITTVHDEALAVQYTVKKTSLPIYIYSTPPTNNQIALAKHRQTKVNAAGSQPFPAFMTSGSGIDVLVHRKLSAGETVLARWVTVLPNDRVMEVVTYQQKNDPLRPNSRAIDIVDKGYVLESDLKKTSQGFKACAGNIFPNENLITDIKQGSFGNCFLLSSILTLLHKPGGSDFIKGMMRQEGMYTVVRLFNPISKQPVYFRVKNSYYNDQDGSVLHQAPWVHILEKAYAAMAISIDEDKEHKVGPFLNYPAFKVMYGNGGTPHLSVTILTGETNAQQIQIPDPTVQYPWNITGLMYSQTVYRRCEVLFGTFKPEAFTDLDAVLNANENVSSEMHKQSILPLLNCLQQNAQPLEKLAAFKLKLGMTNKFAKRLAELEKYFLKHPDNQDELEPVLNALEDYLQAYLNLRINVANGAPLALAKVYKNISQIGVLGKYVYELMLSQDANGNDLLSQLVKELNLEKKFPNRHDLMEMPKRMAAFTRPLPSDIVNDFSRYIQNHVFSNPELDGEVGSGIYSRESLKIFTDIQTKLANQETPTAIIASTRFKFAEGNVAGIVNNHAYALIGCAMLHHYTLQPLKAGEVTEKPPILTLRVRNPWGHTPHSDAESDIDLSQFMRLFTSIEQVKLTKFEPLPHAPLETIIQKNKEGFFKRNKAVLIDSTLGVAALGAGIGCGLGALGAGVTLGLSIPILAAVGFAMGAIAGFLGSLMGCVAADMNAAREIRRAEIIAKTETTVKPARHRSLVDEPLRAEIKNDRRKGLRFFSRRKRSEDEQVKEEKQQHSSPSRGPA